MISFVANTIQVHIACEHPSTGQILFLALKRSSGNPIYPGLWQAVTGTIETGETAIECALREVEEETGLKPKEIWTIPFVGTFFDPYQNSVNAIPVFGVLVDYQEEIRISSEHTEFAWLSLEEFIERVPLPSHKLGAQYFWEYILRFPQRDMFRYRL
jgi:8-oxo-dGTP pyrophosphatase MutT (NUDIX family)